MEFEAFLTSSKRFLDRAWCCLGERLGGDCAEIRTLSKALHSKKAKVRNLTDGNRHFQVLQNAWNQWGKEVVNIRNYMEHKSPFGGRSVGVTLLQGDKEEIRLLIPDRTPERGEKISKEELSFNENRSVIDFARAHMINVDGLMASFMETLADEPSLLEINRKANSLRGDDPPDV